MTKMGKITAVFILLTFAVLYVRQKMGLEGSATVTLGLAAAFLGNITLYIVDAIKARKSGLITYFWINAVSLYYLGAFFFNFGSDSTVFILEMVSAFVLLILFVLVWRWTRKNADKAKYSRLFWDFVPIQIGVLWVTMFY
ncbi:MAG TPA: hypothetical protein VKY29_04455 [Cryomorphaceae bacterium]|nr:hypothetical protein [Cryomorphaceae bacterium]